MNTRAMLVALMISALGLPAVASGQSADDILIPYRFKPAASGAGKMFTAKAIASHKTVMPGDSFHVAVEMTVAKKVWLYGPVPGGKEVKPIPLKIVPGRGDWDVGPVLFAPTREHVTTFPDGTSELNNVYEGTAHAFLAITVPADAEPGRYELPIKISGQVCEESGRCTLVGQDLAVAVEVGGETVTSEAWTGRMDDILSQSKTARQWEQSLAGAPAATANWGRPAGADVTTLTAFALALLAGLILNIMPCVLPVVPLRLLALLEQAGQSRRRFVTLGLAFAGGIVLFFVGIATANLVAKLALQYTIKQADLFRNPESVFTMVLLLVALAVNMFGVFTVTVPGSVASARSSRGHLGAVGMGFLMAVLSTPCSFAIIAAVLSAAVLFLPLTSGTIAIVLIGVGMAAPHALLTAFPKIVERLPRAGRWTELFKQWVGFVFLLVAAWLLGTQMDKAYPAAWVAGYGVVLAMCLWMWGGWVRFDWPGWKKWIVRTAAVAVAVSAGWAMLTPPKPQAIVMRPFDAAEIAQARREGKIVLVKFTAGWCLECKIVDMRIYSRADVAEALSAADVVAFNGDVSRRSMPAEKMLFEKLREQGPPLTVIFPPGSGEPIRLRGSFSREDLFKALDAAREKPPPAL